jgi:hypothetical protein
VEVVITKTFIIIGTNFGKTTLLLLSVYLFGDLSFLR